MRAANANFHGLNAQSGPAASRPPVTLRSPARIAFLRERCVVVEQRLGSQRDHKPLARDTRECRAQ
jgi:hypothetical protein